MGKIFHSVSSKVLWEVQYYGKYCTLCLKILLVDTKHNYESFDLHTSHTSSQQMQDTLENVTHELDCIFKTGCYHYVFSSHDGRNTIRMYLKYLATSAAKRPPRQESISSGLSLDEVEQDTEHVPRQEEKEAQVVVEQWGSEQITDFVRKLGFMESKKNEEQIHFFLQVNEVS